MKYKEKIKVLARLDDKAYEEEFDEDDYSILKELSYDKELTIRALVARILVDSSDEKGEEIEMIVETSRFILFDRLFIRMADSRFGKNIITYDENRDPETYVFDKLNDGLFKVKSIYFDDLDFELEDYLFEVSEHYLCQSFSAMEFRERIKSANSPYHDWYNAITDDDNPVLVLGKVRN